MKEDGEEYSNYISDVLNDHKSKTIKAISAYLLQIMCEKYSGLNSYITNYCIQLMDFQIKGADGSILNSYDHITVDDVIFKLADAERQIETSLLIFSILTTQVIKNEHLQ
jgi:hypothetical protein